MAQLDQNLSQQSNLLCFSRLFFVRNNCHCAVYTQKALIFLSGIVHQGVLWFCSRFFGVVIGFALSINHVLLMEKAIMVWCIHHSPCYPRDAGLLPGFFRLCQMSLRPFSRLQKTLAIDWTLNTK